MLRKLLMTTAIAASLAGSLTSTFAQVIIYGPPPGPGTSSQPSDSPSGGVMDRPFVPE